MVYDQDDLVDELTAANDSETEDNGGENSNVRVINILSDFTITQNLPNVTQSIEIRGNGVAISGGSLTVLDGETLTFSDNISFTGNINLSGDGASLTIGVDTLLGDADAGDYVNGNDDAGLILDMDDDYTLGDGFFDAYIDFVSFTKTGSGDLTLATTYTLGVGLTISDGSLILADEDLLDADETLSIGSGADVDLAGYSQSVGGLSGSGDLDLGSDTDTTLTIGDDDDSTFSGEIAGTGSLVKVGDGKLTLSGESDFDGDVTVQDGELQVSGMLENADVYVEDGGTLILADSNTSNADDNVEGDVYLLAGGTLYGTGTVGGDLSNSGTLDFSEDGANDTITVRGGYTQQSTADYLVEVGSDGSSGTLVVEGVATLDGTLELVSEDDEDDFGVSTQYTVLTAEGGIVGAWSNLVESFAFLDASVVYQDVEDGDGQEAVVTLARNDNDFGDIAANGNQLAVGVALDAVAGTAEDELQSIINTLGSATESTVQSAYESLSGDALASSNTVVLGHVQRLTSRLMDRLSPLSQYDLSWADPAQDQETSVLPAWWSDEPDLDLNGIRDPSVRTIFAQSLDSPQVQEALRHREPEPAAESAATAPDSEAEGWVSYYQSEGELNGQGGAGALSYDEHGVLAGVDLSRGRARPGVYIGYGESQIDYTDRGGQNDVATLSVGVYGRIPLQHLDLSGVAGVGYHRFDSLRTVTVSGASGQATADYSGYSLNMAVEVSKTFTFYGETPDYGTRIEPFARLAYATLFTDSYDESGLGTAGLSVDSGTTDSLRLALGARGVVKFDLLSITDAYLSGRALLSVAAMDEAGQLDVAFVDTPGSGFSVTGAEADDVYAVVGGGLAIPLGDSSGNAMLTLDADTQVGGSDSYSSLSVGVRLAF